MTKDDMEHAEWTLKQLKRERQDIEDDMRGQLDDYDALIEAAQDELNELKAREAEEKMKERLARGHEDFDFMVLCAAKGNMAMYELLKRRD